MSAASPGRMGRRLLDHLLRRALVRGARGVRLSVRPSNRPALALYAAAGFTVVGRRRGYYPAGPGGGREDALVLGARL